MPQCRFPGSVQDVAQHSFNGNVESNIVVIIAIGNCGLGGFNLVQADGREVSEAGKVPSVLRNVHLILFSLATVLDRWL
jgi:hypothetical protein